MQRDWFSKALMGFHQKSLNKGVHINRKNAEISNFNYVDHAIIFIPY